MAENDKPSFDYKYRCKYPVALAAREEMAYMRQVLSIEPFPHYECYYSFYMDGTQPFNPVNCLKFDPHQEILWCSSAYGHVSGFSGSSMKRVMSRPLSKTGLPIHDLEIDKQIIYAILDNEIVLLKKNGLTKYTVQNTELYNLRRSCLPPHRPGLLFVARDNNPFSSTDASPNDPVATLFSLDVEHEGRITQRIDIKSQSQSTATVPSVCNLQAAGERSLCCGLSHGQVMLIDWRNPDSVVQQYHTLAAHTGILSDVSVKPDQNLLVTTGFAERPQGPWLEYFVKVFDLRFKRLTSCLPVTNPPHFVRFLPIGQDRLLVASTNATYSLVEFGTTVPQHPIQTGASAQFVDPQHGVSCLALSSSGQCLAMGGTDGQVVMLGVQSLQSFSSNAALLPYGMYDATTGPSTTSATTASGDAAGGTSSGTAFYSSEGTEISTGQAEWNVDGSAAPVSNNASGQQGSQFYIEPNQLRFNPIDSTGGLEEDIQSSDTLALLEESGFEQLLIPDEELVYRAHRAIPVDADLASDSVGEGVPFYFTMLPFKLDRLGEGLASDWPDELRSDVLYRSQNPVEPEVVATGRTVCGNVIANPQSNNAAYRNVWFPYHNRPLKRNDLLHVPQFRFRDESLSGEFSP